MWCGTYIPLMTWKLGINWVNIILDNSDMSKEWLWLPTSMTCHVGKWRTYRSYVDGGDFISLLHPRENPKSTSFLILSGYGSMLILYLASECVVCGVMEISPVLRLLAFVLLGRFLAEVSAICNIAVMVGWVYWVGELWFCGDFEFWRKSGVLIGIYIANE